MCTNNERMVKGFQKKSLAKRIKGSKRKDEPRRNQRVRRRRCVALPCGA